MTPILAALALTILGAPTVAPTAASINADIAKAVVSGKTSYSLPSNKIALEAPIVVPVGTQAFHLPSGDLSAGDKLKGLDVGGLRVGPLICFEALFPDLAFRQAALHPDFLAVMSIDDWFRGSPAPARLADASRWRATETGLPLVRAGSLGRTMILNAQGAVLQDAPYGGRRLVVAALEKGHGPFPIAWLFPAAALGSLIAVPFAARRRRTLPRGHNSAHEQTSIGRPD